MVLNFRVNDEGNERYVSYDENMTVENFIKDYLKKYSNYVTLDTKIYTFKSQSKILNSKKFLSKTLSSVISDGGQIHLVRKQDTHYSKEK